MLHERAPVPAVLGFALGVGLMLVVKALAERGSPASGGKPSASLVTTLIVDIFIDGLLIGIGFSAGATEGALLTVALTVELLFLGLSATTALGQAGVRPAASIGAAAGLALLAGAGTVVGAALLGGLSGDALEALLAFGLAALLYLVTEELLVEAHEVPETAFTSAVFFLGFICLVVLEMLARPGG